MQTVYPNRSREREEKKSYYSNKNMRTCVVTHNIIRLVAQYMKSCIAKTDTERQLVKSNKRRQWQQISNNIFMYTYFSRTFTFVADDTATEKKPEKIHSSSVRESCLFCVSTLKIKNKTTTKRRTFIYKYFFSFNFLFITVPKCVIRHVSLFNIFKSFVLFVLFSH